MIVANGPPATRRRAGPGALLLPRSGAACVSMSARLRTTPACGARAAPPAMASSLSLPECTLALGCASAPPADRWLWLLLALPPPARNTRVAWMPLTLPTPAAAATACSNAARGGSTAGTAAGRRGANPPCDVGAGGAAPATPSVSCDNAAAGAAGGPWAALLSVASRVTGATPPAPARRDAGAAEPDAAAVDDSARPRAPSSSADGVLPSLDAVPPPLLPPLAAPPPRPALPRTSGVRAPRGSAAAGSHAGDAGTPGGGAAVATRLPSPSNENRMPLAGRASSSAAPKRATSEASRGGGGADAAVMARK